MAANRFRETLPANCPPHDAAPLPAQTALRLVPADPACPADFDSHAAAGRQCPKSWAPCEWASCSMFIANVRREVLTDLRKFPNLRHMTQIAHVSVGPSAGVAKIKASGHIDLWMYATFDPVAAIIDMEPL